MEHRQEQSREETCRLLKIMKVSAAACHDMVASLQQSRKVKDIGNYTLENYSVSSSKMYKPKTKVFTRSSSHGHGLLQQGVGTQEAL